MDAQIKPAIAVDLTYTLLDEALVNYQHQLDQIHQDLHSGDVPYTGWVTYPSEITTKHLQTIIDTAKHIQSQCTAMVVIGIGGSYLGAKACLELLQSPFYNEGYAQEQGLPRVYFAGHHLSGVYYHELLERLANEEVCLCVISKSGSTLEPAVVFNMFKQFMRHKYANQASERIYVITDANHGQLRREAQQMGYTTLTVPDQIGGRYSVLTPVGLLPIAVANIDIQAVITGARQAQQAYQQADLLHNSCYQYGLTRYLLGQKGKNMEIFEVYDGKLRYFAEWLKQLFGESECKEGKGIFPTSLQMSTDLHSMGQFLQDGRQNFFETAVIVDQISHHIPLTNSDLTGDIKTMHQLNRIVQDSAREAHLHNGTPNIMITLPDISAHTFGQMVYFFEKACAVSCYLTGVNPFDQPGVEAYKANIKQKIKG